MNVKVLIVDDSALMRKLFSQLFSRNGLEVVSYSENYRKRLQLK